jgi:hypothetical protein
MFATLRALVYLKRISNSLSRLAVATETLAKLGQEDWEVKNTPRKPRPMVFGQWDREAFEREQLRKSQEGL